MLVDIFCHDCVAGIPRLLYVKDVVSGEILLQCILLLLSGRPTFSLFRKLWEFCRCENYVLLTVNTVAGNMIHSDKHTRQIYLLHQYATNLQNIKPSHVFVISYFLKFLHACDVLKEA